MSRKNNKRSQDESSKAKLKLNCEYCDCEFEYQFLTPLAVTCDCCGSTFDGRLQLVKAYRDEFKQITASVSSQVQDHKRVS